MKVERISLEQCLSAILIQPFKFEHKVTCRHGFLLSQEVIKGQTTAR